MYKDTFNDECLICENSLFKGLDVYRLLIEDSLCYKCRENLKLKIRFTKFENTPLCTLYDYTQETSSLLIRYKDYLDTPLAPIFLNHVSWIINRMFKGYTVVLVPSSQTMIERRKFNHLEMMLSRVNLEIVDPLIKDDHIQRFSDSRIVSFSLKKEVHFDKVLIFDDVITSGSSMKAALNLIKPISNKVVLLSVLRNMN